MHFFFIFLSLFLSIACYSQKNIGGLIQAERNFAAYAVKNGVNEAFLKFADSNGIVFDQAKPVNAIQLWLSRSKRSGILNWRPDRAEIAASGNFGYTTGPWTFQPETINDSIVARGRFITVWQIDKKGEWKFLIDLGVTNDPPSRDTSVFKLKISRPAPGKSLNSLLAAENNFLKALNISNSNAYTAHLSTHVILNRNGLKPAETNPELQAIINSTPVKIDYHINGSGIAGSGDIGFVYGTTIINGKTENYLRIWRKEKVWKIAVEVLRY